MHVFAHACVGVCIDMDGAAKGHGCKQAYFYRWVMYGQINMYVAVWPLAAFSVTPALWLPVSIRPLPP